MTNDQRSRLEMGGQDRQDRQDPRRQPDKDGQHREDDETRREQNEQERGSGQQGPKP